ncbi:MAG: hypothetical protein LBB18_03670 [Puniceicoccales bacterium]|jgi:hypothetical protein|nr:hypothetical protein [Puniceicoccales bacterium]
MGDKILRVVDLDRSDQSGQSVQKKVDVRFKNISTSNASLKTGIGNQMKKFKSPLEDKDAANVADSGEINFVNSAKHAPKPSKLDSGNCFIRTKATSAEVPLVNPQSTHHKTAMSKSIARYDVECKDPRFWICPKSFRSHLNAEFVDVNIPENTCFFGENFFKEESFGQIEWRERAKTISDLEHLGKFQNLEENKVLSKCEQNWNEDEEEFASCIEKLSEDEKKLASWIEKLWPNTNFAEFVFGKHRHLGTKCRYENISDENRTILLNIVLMVNEFTKELNILNGNINNLSECQETRRKQLEDGLNFIRADIGDHGFICTAMLVSIIRAVSCKIDSMCDLSSKELSPSTIVGRVLTQFRSDANEKVIDPHKGTLLNRDFFAASGKLQFTNALKGAREEISQSLTGATSRGMGVKNLEPEKDPQASIIPLGEVIKDFALTTQLAPNSDGRTNLISTTKAVLNGLDERGLDAMEEELLKAPITFEEFCFTSGTNVDELRSKFSSKISDLGNNSTGTDTKAEIILLSYWVNGFNTDLSLIGGNSAIENELLGAIDNETKKIEENQENLTNIEKKEAEMAKGGISGIAENNFEKLQKLREERQTIVNNRISAMKKLSLLKNAKTALENIQSHRDNSSSGEIAALPLGMIREILVLESEFGLIPEFAAVEADKREIMAKLYFPAYLFGTGALVYGKYVEMPPASDIVNPFPPKTLGNLAKRDEKREIAAWYIPDSFTQTPRSAEDLFLEYQNKGNKLCGQHSLNNALGAPLHDNAEMTPHHIVFQVASGIPPDEGKLNLEFNVQGDQLVPTNQYVQLIQRLQQLLGECADELSKIIESDNELSPSFDQNSDIVESVKKWIEDSGHHAIEAISEIASSKTQILSGEEISPQLLAHAKTINNFIDGIKSRDDLHSLKYILKNTQGMKDKILKLYDEISLLMSQFDPIKGSSMGELKAFMEHRWGVKLRSESGSGESLKREYENSNITMTEDFQKALAENRLPNGCTWAILDMGSDSHITSLKWTDEGWFLLDSMEIEPIKINDIKAFLSELQYFELLFCKSAEDDKNLKQAVLKAVTG